jgi:hypothetical protein
MVQGGKLDCEPEVGEEGERMAECARRCTVYLGELTKQSSELLKQVAMIKTTAIKLRETILSFVEGEVVRYNGILQLMTRRESDEEDMVVDRNVFCNPNSMSAVNRKLVASLMNAYDIGDQRRQCPTKDLLVFIQAELKLKSERHAREALKSIFLESVVKHGHVVGISKKDGVPTVVKDAE